MEDWTFTYLEATTEPAPDVRVPGTGLTETEFAALERDLERTFVGTFRRMWLQATARRSVCITAFHTDRERGYEIMTAANVQRFDLPTMVALVRKRQGL